MKKTLVLLMAAMMMAPGAFAQKKAKKAEVKPEGYIFTTVKANPVTPIKNQSSSGTCWAFSTISFLESEAIKAGKADTTLNLSEMFIVSRAYSDKAEKYVRLDGNLNFAGGSDFGDVVTVFKNYGIVPENEMLGLNYGQKVHRHAELDAVLKAYVEAVAKKPMRTLSTAWKRGFEGILSAYLGDVPQKFTVNGKEYTPKSYEESLGLNLDDYVSLTSFTHHPFYESFVIEVPDNWRWSQSYNLPMDKEAAMYNQNAPGKELEITQEMRQVAFDEGTTTDDHGMHVYGIAKDQNGTKYYIVKNSWGQSGKYKGIWYVSVPYVKYKTMNILDKLILCKTHKSRI